MTKVGVTQEDRNAAAPLAVGYGRCKFGYTYSYNHLIKTGELDEHKLVQAFARHRIAAEQRGAEKMREAAAKVAQSCTNYGAANAIRALDAKEVIKP